MGTSVPETLDGLLQAEVRHHVPLGVPRHRPQRHHDDHEDQGERREDQGEGDLVGRALAHRALHEGDHLVEERFTRVGGDANHDPVGEHEGAARHTGAVAAGLPDDGGRLAGDRRLVDRRDALDDLPVARNDLPGQHEHGVPGLQRGRGNLLDPPIPVGGQAKRWSVPAGPAQGLRLGLAALLGEGRREIGEEHGHEEPEVERDEVRDGDLARGPAPRRLGHEQERHEGADLDDEHHRILPLDVRPQHHERLPDGGRDQRGREQSLPPHSACRSRLPVVAARLGAGPRRRSGSMARFLLGFCQ